MAGPLALGLVAYRRIKNVADPDNILWAASVGDVETVRRILQDNRSALLDLDFKNGESAVHRALMLNTSWATKAELVQMLLHAGADPDLPDDRGITIRCVLAIFQLTIRKDEQFQQFQHSIGNLLPCQAGIESLELTFLHEIVLGLCNADLAQVLQSKDPRITSLLNETDAMGEFP